MTDMAQTSLEAYAKSRDALQRQEQEVLDAMSRLPFPSNRDVARALGLEPSTVAGRTNRLLEYGFLKIAGKKSDPWTNQTVRFYEVA